MSHITNYFIITSLMSLIGAGALYDAKLDQEEYEQALLQVYEEGVGLKEYTRSLAYQIDDLRSKKYAKYARVSEQ